MVNDHGKDLPLLIKDGHIINPGQGVNEIANLLISNDIISWLGTGNPPVKEEYNVISARNMIVCPGFIDLHCHLREPGFENKETITTGVLATVKGGFTTVCCMPNTESPIDQSSLVELILNQAKKRGKRMSFLLPVSAGIGKGKALRIYPPYPNPEQLLSAMMAVP